MTAPVGNNKVTFNQPSLSSDEDCAKFARCQSISYNLLLRMDRNHEGISIIRELMDTEDCDVFYSLKELREKTIEHVNAPGNDEHRMSRIRNFQSDDKDKEVANQIASEYLTWYGVELRSSLTYRNWVAYGFVSRYDQFVYFMGFTGWCLNKAIKHLKPKTWR
jgi:hypothetical protein